MGKKALRKGQAAVRSQSRIHVQTGVSWRPALGWKVVRPVPCAGCGRHLAVGELASRSVPGALFCGVCRPMHRLPWTYDAAAARWRRIAPLVAGCARCAVIERLAAGDAT